MFGFDVTAPFGLRDDVFQLGLSLPGTLSGAPVREQLSWAQAAWPEAQLTAAPMLRLAQ